MSFVENNCQQISFWDNINNLSDREKHYLELSWAVPFSEIVFPAINEQPYEVLWVLIFLYIIIQKQIIILF